MVARRKIIAEGNLPLFGTPSEWKAPSLSDLPDWSRGNEVGLDLEFEDPTLRTLGCGARRGAKISGISFAMRGTKGWYLPIRHCQGNVSNPENAVRYVNDMVTNFKGKVLGANITGDLDILAYEKMGGVDGIRFNYNQVRIYDVLTLDAIIYELHFSYSLQSVGNRRKIDSKDKDLLRQAAKDYGYSVDSAGWEACIGKLPAKFVGQYAENDASTIFPIFDQQWAEIKEQGLVEAAERSSDMLVLLLKLRQRGVAINFDKLDEVEKFAAEEEQKALDQIKHQTGVDIGFGQCMAASRVAPALTALGIELPETSQGQPSVTKEVLAGIDHPVAKLIRECREANKIRSTFCSSIRRYETGGRIHTTFRQIVGASDKNEKTGAAFGRLSSVNPNLQQQPSRGKFAKKWRSIYTADPGGQWLSADYSAVEPRWLCHFVELLGLPGGTALGDEYRNNPRVDPHSAMASLVYGSDFTEDQRKQAKVMVLGVTYGMGGAKLSKMHLNLPTRWLVQGGREKHYFETRGEALVFRMKQRGKWEIREVAGEEGQQVMDQFHTKAPFIKEFARKVIEKVEATGVLVLLGGRKIHFPIDDKGNWDWAFKSPNRVIQGTAGAHLAIAMLEVERMFPGFIQLTIHDELCGTCPDLKTAKLIGQCMEEVVKAKVPFRSELEWGPNWGSQRVICNVRGCTNFVNPKDKFGCDEHSLRVS